MPTQSPAMPAMLPAPSMPAPRHSTKALLLALLSATLLGCGGATPDATPFQPATDTQQLMRWIMEPAADIVWLSVQTVMTLEGTEEIAPETDEEWDRLRNAAATLAESGNLLMMEAHAKDHDDWMQISQGLIDVSKRAVEAAQAHDAQALFDAGGLIYNVCTSCHQQYQVSTQPSGDGTP